jgi:hypothetical protein
MRYLFIFPFLFLIACKKKTIVVPTDPEPAGLFIKSVVFSPLGNQSVTLKNNSNGFGYLNGEILEDIDNPLAYRFSYLYIKQMVL